jgi:hypothetical protein
MKIERLILDKLSNTVCRVEQNSHDLQVRIDQLRRKRYIQGKRAPMGKSLEASKFSHSAVASRSLLANPAAKLRKPLTLVYLKGHLSMHAIYNMSV